MELLHFFVFGEAMTALDSLLSWLFPKALIEGTPWLVMWEERDRSAFLSTNRLLLPFIAIAYIAHIWFYDIPNSLEPMEGWVAFRISTAACACFVLGLYATAFRRSRFVRLPALVFYWAICQSQAVVWLVHGRESWVFCFILLVASVLALRMSALNSLIFVLFTVSTQSIVLLTGDFPTSYIFTGTVTVCAITLIVRSTYKSEVENFLLNQRNVAAQKQIIELNIDFAERIRAFIPKVISKRIQRCIEAEGKSVLEASIDVMQPRRRDVACLFSDIRGFTENSKNLESFVKDGVIPEVRAGTEIVESLEGVPRKIGDLLFAYFDDDSARSNVMNAAIAAVELANLNKDMNLSGGGQFVKRFVLLSFGEAVVGNLGGSSSSVEITALGTPVNLLSRVDEATKQIESIVGLESGDILLTERFAELLLSFASQVRLQKILLHHVGVSLRNFPEETVLYKMSPTRANEVALKSTGGDKALANERDRQPEAREQAFA
ncbi:MAG: hypothetical protein AAF662_03350 [Pseudomonadota bacterium]